LILVVPKPAHAGVWQGADVGLVAKLVEQMQSSYTIDPARTVVGGQESGGSIALQAALRQRTVFRAVIAVDAPLMGRPPENEPGQVQSFFMLKGGNRLLSGAISQGIELLRATKSPVTVKDLGKTDVHDSASVAEMVRWIDMLDRI
jgi:poly(3-hydroxybutyrate) depolymerase